MGCTVTAAGGGVVTYQDGNVFDQSSAGSKWLDKYEEGDRDRKVILVNAPGEQGAGSQDFRFDTQSFELTVIYIDASDGNLIDTVQSDLAIMSQVTTVAIASQSFACCKLVGVKGDQSRPAVFGSTYRKTLKLKFMSGRPSAEAG